MIPTAEEFLNNSNNINYKELEPFNLHLDILPFIEADLIEFAKLHVEAALKEASINAETKEECGNPYNPEDYYYVVNKDSILNSYPLTNIK